MGMNTTLSCDRPGCSQTAPASASWYHIRHDDLDEVWLCSTPCLQAWVAELPAAAG